MPSSGVSEDSYSVLIYVKQINRSLQKLKQSQESQEEWKKTSDVTLDLHVCVHTCCTTHMQKHICRCTHAQGYKHTNTHTHTHTLTHSLAFMLYSSRLTKVSLFQLKHKHGKPSVNEPLGDNEGARAAELSRSQS